MRPRGGRGDCVRPSPAGQRTGAGLAHAVPRSAPAPAGAPQPTRRGGAVPGTGLGDTVTNHRRPWPEASPSVRHTGPGSETLDHASRTRPTQPPGAHGEDPGPPGRGRRCSTIDRHAPGRGAGSMAASARTPDRVGAMAPPSHPLAPAGGDGTCGGACADGHGHRPWGVVACWGLPSARRRQASGTGCVGTLASARSPAGPGAVHVTRRVRPRTHGGVGGREGRPSLLPIRPLDEICANSAHLICRVDSHVRGNVV